MLQTDASIYARAIMQVFVARETLRLVLKCNTENDLTDLQFPMWEGNCSFMCISTCTCLSVIVKIIVLLVALSAAFVVMVVMIVYVIVIVVAKVEW